MTKNRSIRFLLLAYLAGAFSLVLVFTVFYQARFTSRVLGA